MEHPGLTVEELRRYDRHLILPGIGETGQRKLKESAVLVVGLGGLGSPVALYLAAAGIGRLGLVDGDTVEETNLQRQVIHDTHRVGTPKVESAASRISELNPWTEVICHPVRLGEKNAAQLIGEYDVIVDATDNFRSRHSINRACTALRKPMVYGAVYQFEGQVSVFAPHLGSPCYRCIFPENVPETREPVGIFGALPGVVGSLQALEVLKLLTGAGKSLLGTLLVVDTLENRFRAIQLTANPDCPVCTGAGGRTA